MNCKRCRKLLHEYLDESLPSRKRASLEEHLQTCDDCRQALTRQQDFSRSLSGLFRRETDSLTLSPAIQRNVLEALQSGAPSPKTHKSYRSVLLRPALALGAAACLLVAALIAFRGQKPELVQQSTPVVPHPKSYIMCMATTYTDDTKTDWIERRLIVVTRNGGEGYLNIIARKPSKPDQTNQNEREENS